MATTREHMELARRTGSRFMELQATGNLGSLMEKLDPSPEAFMLLERSVELARKYGGGDTLSIALANLASACGRVGRREEACRSFSEALEICREHGLGLHRVDYALEMSNVLVDMGKIEEAEALIEKAREWGFPDDYQSYYSCAVGKLLVAQGRNGEAAEIIRKALSGECDGLERFDLLRQLFFATGDRKVLFDCLNEGDLLQREHPHWDTEAKLSELRAAAGSAASGG
jgi:tetratricopeptide (TPR) repeat protein